uniref:C2H2-type domain-containing protein n=1 Tax=Megaselia scalaris TaxID=36166 RepID=T1GZR9_MEGSC
MLTHRNKKPYECKAEGCGKSYCDARSLRRHTENHHQGLVSGAGTGTGSSTTNSNTATISSAISTAVITAKTPNNLSLMSSTGAAPIAASSTGPPTGLSLSPATANGMYILM